MSIKIAAIKVKNLGPIKELDWRLDNVNLVFADNEGGKSYLVEFLLHSLFKTKKWPGLREQKGRGRVLVKGISQQDKEFSPNSDKNVEDFLTKKRIGLPPDFSRLLVLKGSEVGLRKDTETDKKMLRRFLSHKELLEKIIDPLQASVKNAEIEGYTIAGDNRGDIKKRTQLKNKLERLNQLFQEVEEQYLGSELYQLKQQADHLRKQLNKLKKAKKHHAFSLSQQIKKLQKKAAGIDSGKIEELKADLRAWKKDQQRLKKDEQQLKELQKQTKEYPWLVQAVKSYEKLSLAELSPRPKLVLWGAILAGPLLAGLFLYLQAKILSFLSLGITIILAIAYQFYQSRYLKDFGKREELQQLKNQFEQRFSQPFNGLVGLKEKKALLEPLYNKKELEEQRLEKRTADLEAEKITLQQEVNQLIGKQTPFANWEKELKNNQQEKEKLTEEIQQKKLQLTGLGVDKEEYLSAKQDISYQQEEEERIKSKLSKLEEEIADKKAALDNLKHIICENTAETNISMKWNKLIEALAAKKEQVENRYKQLTAQIIGQKKVADVIKELFSAEDEKIDQVLESDLIKQLLPKVTTHYQDLTLENDTLYVRDEIDKFPVAEISAGAREQVFLCLRVALASQWFKNEKMFLILDDAFIHSDSKRREKLVESVVELNKQGWQIICLSFDQRIKQLFDDKAGDYNLLDLNKP
jgi:DNA repair exonuclease SbcCD ATPase subunit